MDEYLTERVEKQQLWYEARANKSKKRFMRNQSLIIVLGAVIPLSVTVCSIYGWTNEGAIFSALVSSIISIVAGLDKLNQPQTAWYNSRAYEESIKKEAWFYKYRAGDYNGLNDRSAQVRFIENVEGIISADIARAPATSRTSESSQAGQPAAAPVVSGVNGVASVGAAENAETQSKKTSA